MAGEPSLSQIAGKHLDVFEAYFLQVDKSKSNAIGALDAAGFLKKSGLSDAVLSRVWDLSDPKGRGFLDKHGFFVALKLVSLAQNEREVSLAAITSEAPAPAMGDLPPGPKSSEDWNIKLAERLKFEQLFDSLGPVNGRLPGNKVKPVMLNSKLSVDALGQVWDLSDMDKDGFLDREEFILAMHLIYQALENHPVPATLPPDLIPPTKRSKKGVLPGSVPVLPTLPPGTDGSWKASFPPPSGGSSPELKSNTTGTTCVPEVPWVVSTVDMCRYDAMFKAADLDNDGFVNGVEIKGLFLQSGLPQPTLAHIWNLCDMKQTGKLNTEQFALAMHLVQTKLQGGEIPPTSLPPEMVPPTLRVGKPVEGTIGDANNSGSSSAYCNPELDLIMKELDELTQEKKNLDKEVSSKETEILMKKGDLETLQNELETLTAAIKQLDVQKGEAQKRLDDLDVQKSSLDLTMSDLRKQLDEETEEVKRLKEQAEDQEKSISEQEQELNAKRHELNDLRLEETKLEQQIESGRNQLNTLSKNVNESLVQITQAKNKMLQMQEQHKRLQDVIVQYDSAISSGDVSSVSEGSLQMIMPVLTEAEYQRITSTATSSPMSVRSGLSTGTTDALDDLPEDPFKGKDPFSAVNGFAHDPFTEDDPFKTEDPFANADAIVPPIADPFGGKDPFKEAFGQSISDDEAFKSSDPFVAFTEQPVLPSGISGKTDPFDPFGLGGGGGDAGSTTEESATNGDPFGGDPFAPAVAPRSESPTPALPPKKSKQPPPRPAPPKNSGMRGPRAAPPAPDPFASGGGGELNSKGSDAFGGNAFNSDPFDPFNAGSVKDPFTSGGDGGDQFVADFANFDKCSSSLVGGGGVWGMSEEDQLAWATTDSLRMEQERRKEDAEYQLALTLSRNDSATTGKH